VIEGADLTGIQTPLPPERRQIGDAPGPRALERRGCVLCLGLEGLNLPDAGREFEGEALQLRASIFGVGRRLGALAGAPLELVEAGHGVVQGRSAEEDGDGIRLSLLVQGSQTVAQKALGRPEVACDDGGLPLDTVPLEPEAVCTAPEAGQLAPSLQQA
jgi:hypothetical protein